MAATAPASPDDIDVLTLAGSLKRAAPRLIALSLLAGALTYAVLSLIAPVFSSKSELAIIARGTSNPFTAPQSGGPTSEVLTSRMDKEAVNTHVRALMSPDIALKVAQELDLASRPEFNGALGPVDRMEAILRAAGLAGVRQGESDEDRVLNAFVRRLQVYSPKESRAITIEFSSIDAELAAEVANRIAETYRQRLAKATVIETDTVQRALEPKIDQLSREVAAADAEVESFRAKAGLVRGGTQRTPVNEQQLGELTTELGRASAARSEVETRARSAREQMRRGDAEVIPEVQRSPLIQNLVQQRVQVERDLLKLSASMKSAHPVIRQLDADLTAVKRQIASEVAKIVSGLDKEAFIAAQQEAAVRLRLEELKSQVVDNSSDEVQLRQLQAVADAKRSELERLQAQFEANRARADSNTVPVEAQILTRARPASQPVFPKKMPFTLLAMIAMLLLGTAGVITAGLARGARRVPPALQGGAHDFYPEPAPSGHGAGMPVLPGARPRFEAPRAAEAVAAARAVRAVPAGASGLVSSPEAFAHRIAPLWTADGTGVRTLVASPLRPADTARLVLACAEELASIGGATLVVDWSTSGVGIASAAGLRRIPGVTELVHGAASFADVIRALPGSGVHMIACGSAIAESADGLDADQLNLILDALDEAYRHIIVVGDIDSSRKLFGLIQGRFDVGVTVLAANGKLPAGEDGGRTFLGFDVSDIELVRLKPEPAPQPKGTGSRTAGGPLQPAPA